MPLPQRLPGAAVSSFSTVLPIAPIIPRECDTDMTSDLDIITEIHKSQKKQYAASNGASHIRIWTHLHNHFKPEKLALRMAYEIEIKRGRPSWRSLILRLF